MCAEPLWQCDGHSDSVWRGESCVQQGVWRFSYVWTASIFPVAHNSAAAHQHHLSSHIVTDHVLDDWVPRHCEELWMVCTHVGADGQLVSEAQMFGTEYACYFSMAHVSHRACFLARLPCEEHGSRRCHVTICDATHPLQWCRPRAVRVLPLQRHVGFCRF
jgi:hypothetical protein